MLGSATSRVEKAALPPAPPGASSWLEPCAGKLARTVLRGGTASNGRSLPDRKQDVDELLSEFALAHVEGSAMVAGYARDKLLEKRRPVMQWWADRVSS